MGYSLYEIALIYARFEPQKAFSKKSRMKKILQLY